MSNVYTTSIGVPMVARNKRNYGKGFYNSNIDNSINNIGSKTTPKEIIDVINDALPTISDYQATYAAVHGEYPLVRLIIIVDANTEYESAQRPQFTKVDGLIDTIFFDLGSEFTGYIILQ